GLSGDRDAGGGRRARSGGGAGAVAGDDRGRIKRLVGGSLGRVLIIHSARIHSAGEYMSRPLTLGRDSGGSPCRVCEAPFSDGPILTKRASFAGDRWPVTAQCVMVDQCTGCS